MNLLVLNCGSSTLKFDLLEVGEREPRHLAHGLVDRIGRQSSMKASVPGQPPEEHPVRAPDHHSAVAEALRWLRAGPTGSASVAGVGHRVVHGGERFRQATLIDDAMLSALEELSELAPLHNPAAVAGIRAAREALGAAVRMVAVFDTAFHADLPPRACRYALPADLVERYRIRRYGFHGIAHADMLRQYAAMSGRPAGKARLVTFHLGNGCSAAAIEDGRSVDTSMGFTPLEGLVMGSRSGDLDPSLVAFLAERERVPAGEVERWLNERSGLLGVSGLSGDMRDLLAAEPQNAGARLAVDLFCYRARKYLGAYLAALGGADAVVFGGGIGEHAPAVRARICGGMEWCGLRLDPARNSTAVAGPARISADDAVLHAYVAEVDEARVIAQETIGVLRGVG